MKSGPNYLIIAVFFLDTFILYECSLRDEIKCVIGNDTYYPDCNNCTRYWKCNNGQPTHLTCSGSLWFNFIEKQCDLISNYPVLNGCGDTRCTEGPNRRKYEVNQDKRKFVWCISGYAFLYSCCNDNQDCYFDVKHQTCVINFEPGVSLEDEYDSKKLGSPICDLNQRNRGSNSKSNSINSKAIYLQKE